MNIIQDKRLSTNDRKVYHRLFLLSQDKGYCHSTDEYLSMVLSIPYKEISKSIKKLQALKFIKVANLDRDNIKGRKIFINL